MLSRVPNIVLENVIPSSVTDDDSVVAIKGWENNVEASGLSSTDLKGVDNDLLIIWKFCCKNKIERSRMSTSWDKV